MRMALYADNNNLGRSEPWDHSVDVPMSARFTMLGRLQVQQSAPQQPIALDFSSRTSPPLGSSPFMAVAPPRHSSPPIGGAVDLSKRARNSICDDSSSSSGSSITDVKPVILPALLQQHVDTVTIAAPIPTVVTPPFTSMFKKSPSMTRPFKAYPKDPLNLPLGLVGGVTPAETMLNAASNEAYAEFRRQMLAQVSAAKTRRAGSPTKDEAEQQQQQIQPTQPEELGSPQQPSSSATDPSVGSRDPAYWERRRKNNEAAKRSRDARRAKEDEIAIRAAFLEQENLKLKYEVAALRNETSRLRCMLYSSS